MAFNTWIKKWKSFFPWKIASIVFLIKRTFDGLSYYIVSIFSIMQKKSSVILLQCVHTVYYLRVSCIALQVFYDAVKKKSIELRHIKLDKSEIRAVRNMNGEIYFMSQNKVWIIDFVWCVTSKINITDHIRHHMYCFVLISGNLLEVDWVYEHCDRISHIE